MKISISVFTVLALMASALAAPVPEPLKKVATVPDPQVNALAAKQPTTAETARVRTPSQLASQIIPAAPNTPVDEQIIANPLPHAKLLGKDGVKKAQTLNGEVELATLQDETANMHQRAVDAALVRLENDENMSAEARKKLVEQIRAHIVTAEKARVIAAKVRKDVRKKRKALKAEIAKKLKSQIAQNMKAGIAKGADPKTLAKQELKSKKSLSKKAQ